MYRHFCPKCRTVYYSAAMSEATKPWICGVCRHVVVHSTAVEERVVGDDEGVTVAGRQEGSRMPEEKKRQGVE